MKKTVCSMLLCYFCLCMVYPSSPKGMRICVINYTSGNLIITYELRNGKSQECYNYLWRQVIDGVFLMIGDKLHDGKLSMQSRQYRNGRFFPAILKLWPIVNWPSESDKLQERYDKLYAIPFMTLMKEVYKTFTVSTEDGKVLITLDSLPDVIIKKRVNLPDAPVPIIDYFIKVFDYDLVGKPASEW